MFKKILKILLIIIFLMVCAGWFFVSRVPKVEPKNFGITYSVKMAKDFGIDWQEAFEASLEDLGVKKIRIPVYWDEVEKEEGVWDFSQIDWMLEQAEKYDAEIVLAVGKKVPRWPECHTPHWVREFSISNSQFSNEKLLNYIETTIKRYDDKEVVKYWQIENEPFLKFGICPNYDPYFVDEEIKLVKSLSDKKIIMSDGGEFGDWVRAYKRTDVFGSTLYRHIVSRFMGEWTYPIPSWVFRLRQGIVKTFYGDKPRIVIELQSEPWIDGVVKDSTVERQYEGFGPERFKEMMKYIEGTGFDTFYFWGVEWWYFLKEQGHPEMWDLAKEKISS